MLRSGWCALLSLLAALSAGSPNYAAETPSIPLTVTEEAGQTRARDVVRLSVPFARGRVRDTRALWIADIAGHPTLHQAAVLERWPDESLRWVAVDFFADVPARETRHYALHTDGPRPQAVQGGLRELRDGDAMSVDTGTCRIALRDGNEGVVVELKTPRGLQRIAVPLPTAETDLKAQMPTTIDVRTLSHGPVTAEWRFSSRTADGMQAETRIETVTGRCTLRVQHTLTNTAHVDSTAALSRVVLSLPLAASRGAVGVDGKERVLATVVPTREVRQLDATTVLLDTARDGSRLDGWARATTDDLTVTAVIRDLWQQFPAGFRLGNDHFDVDLVAAPQTPLRFGVGAAKTWEAWLAFGPATAPDGLRHPLLATTAAAYIVSTKALPQAIAPDDPEARAVLARLTTALDHYLTRNATERWDDGPPLQCAQRDHEQPRTGFFGVLNWGDWNFPKYRDDAEGCDAWGNLEYDLPQVLGLLWAATGSPLAREQFVAATRHYRDVDIIHFMPAHPDWVGMNHPHKMSHFAVEAPNQIDLGHTWVEGLLTHYRLTGEARSLAAARGIATVLTTRVDKAGNPRQFGWPLIALLAVHNAIGDADALTAAREYAVRAMRQLKPTPASGDWKMGILADGLAYFDAATNDAPTRQWLLQYADAWLAGRERFTDPRFALPLGYLAAVTGNPAYRAAALDVARSTAIGEWGKTLAATGRTVFRLLAPLAPGLTPPAPVAPPRRSAPALRRSSPSR